MAAAAARERETREVADIHQRLDSITRQIEQMSRPAARKENLRDEQGVARQLNDAISRLDARLSQISSPLRKPAPGEQHEGAEGVERAAAQLYRQAPPLSASSLDSAVAEISARQNELDNASQPPRVLPSHMSPPTAPAMAPAAAPAMTPPAATAPDYSSLERQLLKITSQIEALHRPDDGLEQSIAAFRNELAEIRHAITEAMPRRAIETIENEIRSLSRRIDENRQSGVDGQALAGIERALTEIGEVVRSLTPAEQLTGYAEAIHNLGAKLDLILRTNDDPGTVQQLESAISALRGIVANVASNDALARLSDDLKLLSAKVDQLTEVRDNRDSFAALEQRIAALALTLEGRERAVAPVENSAQIEEALRGLSDRIDRLQVGNDSASAFTHLEQRISYLLERLEAAHDPRGGNMSRVEDGLQDILRYLERQQATFAALTEARSQRGEPAPDSGLFDLVKRELSDIRSSQSETGRHTQDSLEAVHSALGHVVDRLAVIEGDLRNVRAAPLAPPIQPQMAGMPPSRERLAPDAVEGGRSEAYRPELPNPAAMTNPPGGPQATRQGTGVGTGVGTGLAAALASGLGAGPAVFAAAPRDFHAAGEAAPVPTPPIPPKAIADILEPHAAQAARAASIVVPELPPDHPLEPGTRPPGRTSPAERIAASESALSDLPAGKREPVSTSSFIAAARRAAQAAAAAQPPEPKKAPIDKAKKKDKPKDTSKPPAKVKDLAGPVVGAEADENVSTLGAKIRSLLVGASVVVIVLGTFKLAMSLLDSGSAPPPPAAIEGQSQNDAPQGQMSAPAPSRPATPEQTAPSLTSPTPIDRQSYNRAMPSEAETISMLGIPQDQDKAAADDATGTIPTAANGQKLSMIQVPPTERLPDSIGGLALRNAALKGDPTAAYEVGLRFAEGKGIAANLDEAAKWYDRAAQAGLIPAIFRLGTFYEKGMGVKKDVDIARRYYVMAAERGNAKAMHNLAVLDADGGGKGANYKSASQWFRKAAERGVADSQFNLGILYARGIGVEQNLAESYKWFSLAAAQGDADAGRKRDDVAKRLDPQSLAAAKLAIQTFTAEPQPDDAVSVPAPAGGWDAPVQAATKPGAKPALTKRVTATAAAAR